VTDEFQQFSKRDTKAQVTKKILKHEITERKKDNTLACESFGRLWLFISVT